MGPPPDPRGHLPFTPYSVFFFFFSPYSGFTRGTPVFTHYTSARWRYAPMMLAVINNNKIKKNFLSLTAFIGSFHVYNFTFQTLHTTQDFAWSHEHQIACMNLP